LALQVRYCGVGRPSEDEIVRALLRIPPHAVAQGRLSLEARHWETGDGNPAGTGKRKIVHLRGAMP